MLRVAVVVLVGVVCFGCGKDSDDDPPAAGISELQGTWSTACITPSAGGIGSSSKTTYAMSGTGMVSTINQFSDAACATILLISKVSGTMAAAGDASTPEGAKKYDFTFVDVTQTIKTAAFVAAANAAKLCQVTDWAVDTEKSVIGKTCGAATYTAGKILYDIYKLNSPTVLAVGLPNATNDGSTDAKRMSALDPATYTKQ